MAGRSPDKPRQNPTEISMRRPKQKLSVRTLAIAGGVAAVLVVALVLLNVLGGDDDVAPVADTASASEPAASVTEQSAPVAEQLVLRVVSS